MKKALLFSSFQIATVASALAQGSVIFEEPLTGTFPTPITFALMWAPGTTPVPDSLLTQLGTYGPVNSAPFSDPNTLVTGAATAGGTSAIFEVQAWSGNFPNQAAALAGGAQYVYESYEFVNGTGNPNPPATPPVFTTGWDGTLHLVPEPSTFALGGIGAAVFWMWRRKNNDRSKTTKQDSI
jgi:hypothetical protein